MSTALAVARTPGVGTQNDTLANMGTYLMFTLKRNWVRFVVWFVLVVGMLAFIATYYQGLFAGDAGAKELQTFVQTVNSPALLSMVGLITHPVSIAGATWCKAFMMSALMLGIGIVFLMTRNLRADEDQGRAELVRAYPLGIHSRLAASVILMSALSIVIGVFTALVMSSLNLCELNGQAMCANPGPSAWVFGLSLTGAGLVGVGIGALTNELAPSSGSANGMGTGLFGLFYLMRIIGDVQTTWTPGVSADGFQTMTPSGWGQWLTWVSPIGWSQKMDPWGANLVWPLLLSVAFTAVLVALAWALQSRRDLGDSIAPERTGKANASRTLTTVWGLGARLQRGSLIGWFIGVFVFAAVFGSVTTAMHDLLTSANLAGIDNLHLTTNLLSVVANLFMPLLALVVSIFAAQSATMMRSDESRGVLESQLGTSVGRTSWVLQRLAVTFVAVLILLFICGLALGSTFDSLVPDANQMWPIIGSFYAYVPACMIVAGIFVLGFGWWPRFSVAVTWIVIGALWVIMIVGLAVPIPKAVLDAMPFNATPKVPYDAMNWPPVLWLTLVTVVFIVLGLVGFRRRNVPA